MLLLAVEADLLPKGIKSYFKGHVNDVRQEQILGIFVLGVGHLHAV